MESGFEFDMLAEKEAMSANGKTDYIPGVWYPWIGTRNAVCPVPERTLVCYRLRGETREERLASPHAFVEAWNAIWQADPNDPTEERFAVVEFMVWGPGLGLTGFTAGT